MWSDLNEITVQIKEMYGMVEETLNTPQLKNLVDLLLSSDDIVVVD